jgi:hypothetical protein
VWRDAWEVEHDGESSERLIHAFGRIAPLAGVYAAEQPTRVETS